MDTLRVVEITRNKRAKIRDLVLFESHSGGGPVAVIRADCYGNRAANARLFASAPQLLEALKQVREMGYNSQAVRATDTVLACIRVAEQAISLIE